MQSLTAPITQAPNVDAFQSPIETGYNAGWSQMSDAMQRMQKKRSLDQTDQEIALKQQQLQLEARRLALSEWSTRVQAQQTAKASAVNANLEQRRLELMAQRQDFEIDQTRKLEPLEIKKNQLDMDYKDAQIRKINNELDQGLRKSTSLSSLEKRETSLFDLMEQQKQTEKQEQRTQALRDINKQVKTSLSTPKFKISENNESEITQ